MNTADGKPAKKREVKAAPSEVGKNFAVPTANQWSNKTTRKSILKKLPLMVSIKFAFEMAAQEVLAIRKQNLKMPVNHLKVLVSAYRQAMSFKPPVTAAKRTNPQQMFTEGQLREFAAQARSGKMKRIDGHWVKLSGAIQKLYYNNNCSFTYRVNQIQYVYEYRSIRTALETVARDRPSQVKIWNSVTDSAQLIFADYPWERQVSMLKGLIAAHVRFGHFEDFKDQFVINDWLEERGLELLLFPQIAMSVEK